MGTYLLTLILLVVLRKTSGCLIVAEKMFVFTVVFVERTESEKTGYTAAERSGLSHIFVAGGDSVCDIDGILLQMVN